MAPAGEVAANLTGDKAESAALVTRLTDKSSTRRRLPVSATQSSPSTPDTTAGLRARGVGGNGGGGAPGAAGAAEASPSGLPAPTFTISNLLESTLRQDAVAEAKARAASPCKAHAAPQSGLHSHSTRREESQETPEVMPLDQTSTTSTPRRARQTIEAKRDQKNDTNTPTNRPDTGTPAALATKASAVDGDTSKTINHSDAGRLGMSSVVQASSDFFSSPSAPR